uniref:FLYWCH-type domain-containing protein n=1 Tax=Tetranychus urticae TaxID=32264 RepID=A0A158P4X1_TETUR
MEYKFIKSSRGAKLLVFHNYVYRKRNRYGNSTYWTCIVNGCKGKVTMEDDLIVNQIDHCHEPDLDAIISREQKNYVKELAGGDNYPKLKRTYNEANHLTLQSSCFETEQVASSLRTFSSIKNTISRARSARYPALPIFRSMLEISDSLSCNSSGEKFFRFNGGNDDKILVFATDNFLKLLAQSDHVYCDGTFKSFDTMISTQVYMRLLRIVQDLCSEIGLIWNPSKFTTDFELAAMKAIKTIFLILKESDTNSVLVTVKRISALPFLKLTDLESCMNRIRIEAPQDQDMIEFINYFESTYFCYDSRFPPETWNHYNDHDPRTNNHVEGWHFALNRSVGRYHANIWFYIELSNKNNYEVSLLMSSFGAIDNKKKCKYVKLDERLKI